MNDSEDFLAAARAFVAMAGRITPVQWDAPGLGAWTVRDLVGHTGRTMTTVAQYLAAGAAGAAGASGESGASGASAGGPEVIPDAETYYRRIFEGYTDHAAVARRGVEAGELLGDDPVGFLNDLLARVTAALEAAGPGARVIVGSYSLELAEYLRTRNFELVVHGFDIARATGGHLDMPLPIVADAAALAARVAALGGSGREVLFALTGRDALPGGFSIF